MLRSSGHYADAAAVERRLLELDPAFEGAHSELSKTLLLMSRSDEALAEAQKEDDEERRLEALALVYWALHRRADADAALGALESKHAATDSLDIATVHAYRGEVDAAVSWLERAYAESGNMIIVKTDPLLQNLRGDSRYEALLGKLNMPAS